MAVAMPRLAVVRRKPVKTVRFAELPMIVLVMDTPSDEYTFDNKEDDGTPRVGFHSIKASPRKRSASGGPAQSSRRSWHTLVPRT